MSEIADSSAREEFSGEFPDAVDVVVVGGGIAGCSAVYHLADAGVSVALLERDAIAGGTTGAAAGILSPPLRQPFHETVRFRGADNAKAMWEFALRSVAGLGALMEERGVADDVELDLSGGYVLAETYTEHEVTNSFEALSQAAFPVQWLSAQDAQEVTGGHGFTSGYRIEGGGAIQAAAATVELARAAAEQGAVVREGVQVREVTRVDGGFRCATNQKPVRAEMVVYAAHTGMRPFSAFLADEIVPIRGQGFVTAPVDLDLKGCFASHWKLNLWRQDRAGRLMVSGWRHDAWDRAYYKARPELDPSLQDDLKSWLEVVYPELGALDVESRWSGVFGWTADYLPLVGPLPGRTGELVIGGFSGGGLPFAFECGRVIGHTVADRKAVPGSELFNPRRFT